MLESVKEIVKRGNFQSTRLSELARSARPAVQDESAAQKPPDPRGKRPEAPGEDFREKLPNQRDPQDVRAYRWLKERGFR